MLNWRARKPSTASVTPATTKTMKANSVLLVEINQMQSGTRKSLAMEMRLGMVIGWLISAPAACFFPSYTWHRPPALPRRRQPSW